MAARSGSVENMGLIRPNGYLRGLDMTEFTLGQIQEYSEWPKPPVAGHGIS